MTWLAMIEDDWFARASREFTLHSPVSAMRRVSYDMDLSRPLDLADGRTMTALELQWEHLDLARKYAEERGLDAVGGVEVGGRRQQVAQQRRALGAGGNGRGAHRVRAYSG